MKSIHLQLPGKSISIPGAHVTNHLGDYHRFELHNADVDPFEACAQPFTATLHTARGTLAVNGFTGHVLPDQTLGACSTCWIADVAVRTRDFDKVTPQALIQKVLQPYAAHFRYQASFANTDVKDPFVQFQLSDYDFLTLALPGVMVVDTGRGVRYAAAPLNERVLEPADFPFGPGGWHVDVSAVGVQAVSQGLDPHRRLEVNLETIEVPGSHPDVKRLLDAVQRFQKLVPPAGFLTNSENVESLRRRVHQLAMRSLAHAGVYHFRTDRIDVAVGDRIVVPSRFGVRGPLVVVSTEADFDQGDYVSQVQAAPEPLAPFWGLRTAGRCEALTLGTVLEGEDPAKLGRVPIRLLRDATSKLWARATTPFAHADRKLYSRFRPDEEVLVGFLHGDPATPLILGALFHSKTKPPVTGPNEVVFVNDKIALRLSDAGIELLLGDNRFRMTADGMNWSVGGQQLTLKPSGLCVATDQPVTVKGSRVKFDIPGHVWQFGG